MPARVSALRRVCSGIASTKITCTSSHAISDAGWCMRIALIDSTAGASYHSGVFPPFSAIDLTARAVVLAATD
jgi:hypothetical protein